MKLLAFVFWLALVPASLVAEKAATNHLQWIQFPDSKLKVSGLPWMRENAPELWRLPKSSQAKMPKGVWNRAVAPDGGRVRFSSDTSHLALKVQVSGNVKKPCFFETYVDGKHAGEGRVVTSAAETTMTLFSGKNRQQKDITIYLPNNHECRVLAVGIDSDAKIKTPSSFALKKPIVCYGSSVLQGTGAAHPSKTYPAVLARQLNLDFVNLGFGGAGKAEPDVVALVNQLEASCFIFDLGKSYGDQPIEPYALMLDTIRASHPKVPIFCVTPIYSVKEEKEPAYHERSEKLRALMRQAATERRTRGDKLMFVVEGMDLFGAQDKEFFNDPLHPNDAGNERLAHRLAPIVERIVLQKKSQ